MRFIKERNRLELFENGANNCWVALKAIQHLHGDSLIRSNNPAQSEPLVGWNCKRFLLSSVAVFGLKAAGVEGGIEVRGSVLVCG